MRQKFLLTVTAKTQNHQITCCCSVGLYKVRATEKEALLCAVE